MDVVSIPQKILNTCILLIASMLSICIKALSTLERGLLQNTTKNASSLLRIEPKPPSISKTIISQVVAPQYCDQRGVAYGGAVLSWVDITAGIAAKKHSELLAVTASLDSVAFAAPLYEGEIVNVQASVNRTWKTSMEVGVRVEAENPISSIKRFCCHAYLTFVGLKALGQPTSVPPILPETENEKRRFDEAELRRNARNARRKDALPIEPINIRQKDMINIDTPRNSVTDDDGKISKTVFESYSETSRIVFPGHANAADVLFGGYMILYMEQIGAIAASRHTETFVVTASIDSLNFIRSAQIGDVVTLRAIVTAAFVHSVEVYVTCETTNGITNNGYITMVAVDEKGNLIKVPRLICETKNEIVRHAEAWKRRDERLTRRSSLR